MEYYSISSNRFGHTQKILAVLAVELTLVPGWSDFSNLLTSKAYDCAIFGLRSQ
jgi:hypothetical protein